MENLIIPANYRSELNLYETQEAISTIKQFFQQALSEQLTLLRVTAPLFVTPESGLNDNLNGIERPVDLSRVKALSSQTCRFNYFREASASADSVIALLRLPTYSECLLAVTADKPTRSFLL